MKLESKLDTLHKKTISNRLLQVFTAFTRILLGIGFIYPSIPKIMYRPFTLLPESDPVGHYFSALYQTGFYYQFIGWSQLIAAILLLIPRTSHIGALLFFPIILNITVLTNSVGFKGTWLVTIFMSLAALYLVCWDYDRWKRIIFTRTTQSGNSNLSEMFVITGLFAASGIALWALMGTVATPDRTFPPFRVLGVLVLAGAVFGIIVAIHKRYMVLPSYDKNPGTDNS